jgi:hypothetical protein
MSHNYHFLQEAYRAKRVELAEIGHSPRTVDALMANYFPTMQRLAVREKALLHNLVRFQHAQARWASWQAGTLFLPEGYGRGVNNTGAIHFPRHIYINKTQTLHYDGWREAPADNSGHPEAPKPPLQ